MNSLDLLINKTITFDEFKEQLQLSLFEDLINFIRNTKAKRKTNKLVGIILN